MSGFVTVKWKIGPITMLQKQLEQERVADCQVKTETRGNAELMFTYSPMCSQYKLAPRLVAKAIKERKNLKKHSYLYPISYTTKIRLTFHFK